MMDLKCMLVTGSTSTSRFDLRHPFTLHSGEKVDPIKCASMYTDLVGLLSSWQSRMDRRSVTLHPCFPSSLHSPRQRPKEAISLCQTFPASGAHCCYERSVSSPRCVKLTLCSLTRRNIRPYAIGSHTQLKLHLVKDRVVLSQNVIMFSIGL